MSFNDRSRNAVQCHDRQVLLALEGCDFQRELRAACSAHSGLGCGAWAAGWPILEALQTAFLATVGAFIVQDGGRLKLTYGTQRGANGAGFVALGHEPILGMVEVDGLMA